MKPLSCSKVHGYLFAFSDEAHFLLCLVMKRISSLCSVLKRISLCVLRDEAHLSPVMCLPASLPSLEMAWMPVFGAVAVALLDRSSGLEDVLHQVRYMRYSTRYGT